MASITGAVGRGGRNDPTDVKLIQTLLNRFARKAGFTGLVVDGIAGPRTVAAIEAVQKRILGFSRPDGRVDPAGATLRALTEGSAVSDGLSNTVMVSEQSPRAGKVTGKLTGVGSDITAFLQAVAAHYGRNIAVSSGKRDARHQGVTMFNYWTVNLDRGRKYRYLSRQPALLKEMDGLYRAARETRSASAAERAKAKEAFIALCARHADKLSLHVAGRAVDISPKASLTPPMREALKTGLRELVENSCYHYDAREPVKAVTDELRRRWPAG